MAKRILIADDNEPMLRAVRVLLESNPNWKICGEAMDGREAVAKAVELHPDLIILDVVMPRMDGLTAATEIHKLLPTIPIVMHTSYGSLLDRGANAHGIRRIVDKATPGALVLTVEEMLREVTLQPDVSDETAEISAPPIADPTPDVAVAAAPVAPVVQEKAVEEPKSTTPLNVIKAD